MKISKQLKWILASALCLVALVVAIAFNLPTTTDEITPRQLHYIIQKKLIAKATVTPTPYTGIYTIEGHWGKTPPPDKTLPPQPCSKTSSLKSCSPCRK